MKDKIKRIIVKNYRWMIIFIGLILFLVILEDILDYEIKNFDVWGYNVVARSISDYMTPIAKIITKFGNAESLILITIISCFVVKGKKNKWAIPINLACVATLNLTLKNIIQRPRPIEYRIVDENGYSFPSGHSMVSMAFYGFLIYLIYKNVKNKYIKVISMLLLSALIFLIGASRIYLGVHYTSDVIGGFLLAIVYLVLYTGILK
ncbi:MAG: phosphatase PAP2 family protein [Clostridia bacterium]|nr:phosphatase PAP2 family protein [Clostridia bacterium]